MARHYLPVDRDQQFLLPVDMREWLPDDHLALFVVELVRALDLGALHATYRLGAQGRCAYDPEMLFALWVYAACCGVRSSREIECRCRSDIAFRFICANHIPDHATLARFRQRCDAVIEELFCALLGVCAEAGLVSLGVVAVDGTKVAANAALSANQGEGAIRARVRKLLDDAEATDTAEDAQFGEGRGDELPEGLSKAGRERLVRLKQAAARVAARTAATTPPATESRPAAEAAVARARAEQAAELAAFQRARAEAAATGAPRPRRGAYQDAAARRRRAERRLARLAAAPPTRAPAPPKANTTDPDSAVMPTASGAWVQGYNLQAAVSADQLIVATCVSDSPTDVQLLEPMIAATLANLRAAGAAGRPGAFVADAGYWSTANAAGGDRLIATTKGHKLRRHARELGAALGPPPDGASPAEAMQHRLRTPEGAALYATRATTVEPVIGQLKDRQSLRRFMRRGRAAVQAEATFAAFAHNARKLFSAREGLAIAWAR